MAREVTKSDAVRMAARMYWICRSVNPMWFACGVCKAKPGVPCIGGRVSWSRAGIVGHASRSDKACHQANANVIALCALEELVNGLTTAKDAVSCMRRHTHPDLRGMLEGRGTGGYARSRLARGIVPDVEGS